MRRGITGLVILGWSVLFAEPGWLLSTGPTAATASPTEPAGGWVVSYFDQARLLGPGRPYFVATGPCERLDLAGWIGEMADAVPGATRRQWLRGALARDLAPETAYLKTGMPIWVVDAALGLGVERHSKPAVDAAMRAWLYTPSGFSLWTSMRTTANRPECNRVAARPWRERWRASLDYGGIGYRRGAFACFAGRDEVSWGASRLWGLLFSGSAPVMDMLKFTARSEHVLFTSLHSQLRRSADDPWDDAVRRFVAAHRLEVLAGDHWDFSVSEVVLYAGRGRDFEPVYLNPLAPLYAEQWNARWDDNLFFDADVLLRLPGRAEIRAEVLIDDLQIDPGSEPNEVGLFLGVDAVNPLAPDRSLLGCSYARLANRTYGHAAAWNRFLHEGRVMGYLGGPDGDRLSAWCSWAPVASLDLTATYSLTRQGEGRADDPQDQPGHETSFPSGTVETTHMVAAGLGWRPVYPLRVAALAEWSAGRNVGNLEGEDTDGFRGSLSITYDVRVWGEMD